MSELMIYTTSNGIDINVEFENENIWLSRNQLSILFDKDVKTIGKHINNIFQEEELQRKSTVSIFATVQKEGKRNVKRNLEFYNLDAIISVGYRINSKKGTQFRQWATQRLKDHLIKGFTINEKRLLELNKVLQLIDQNKDTINNNEINEAKGLLDILSIYTKSFILLNKFDSNDLNLNNLNYNITYEIKYDEAIVP
jgi:hypothetical protein